MYYYYLVKANSVKIFPTYSYTESVFRQFGKNLYINMSANKTQFNVKQRIWTHKIMSVISKNQELVKFTFLKKYNKNNIK